MAVRATQETLTSLDRAEYLIASTRTHMPTVSPKLAAFYGTLPPAQEGDPPRVIDFDHVQESNVFALEQVTRDARDKSHAYRVARSTLSQVRKARKSQSKILRRLYRDYKRSFEAGYGPEALALVGLDGGLAGAYTAVREQCLDLADQLRRPDLLERLGEARPGHLPLEIEQMVTILLEALQAFKDLTAEATRLVKVKDEALVAKREALRHQRRVLANVARIQEGYYRLAGLDDLADRIRVTIPKRSAKKADDTPSGEPSDDTPTPEPASDDAPGAKPPRDQTP